MPEVDLPIAPPRGSNSFNGNDVSWEDVEPGGVFFETVQSLGDNGGKSPIFARSGMVWDTQVVPPNSVVNKAKLTVKADAAYSTTMTSDLRGIVSTEPAVTDPDTVNHDRFRTEIYLSAGLTVLGGTTATARTSNMILRLDRGHSAHAQSFIVTTAGTADRASFYGRRTAGTVAGNLIVTLRDADGSAGSYTPGAIRAQGQVGGASLSTTLGLVTILFNVSFSVSLNDVYFLDWGWIPTSSTSDEGIEMMGEPFASTTYNPHSAGTPRGFTEWCYFSGTEMEDEISMTATTASVPSMPTFVANQTYTFGDSAYSPDVTVADFTALVQELIDARGSNNLIGMLWRNPSPAGVERAWYSSRSTTETLPGLFGAVLTIDYTAGGTRRQRQIKSLTKSRRRRRC